MRSGSYCARKRFLISTRKPNGTRRPRSALATTRYVRPAALRLSALLEVGEASAM